MPHQVISLREGPGDEVRVQARRERRTPRAMVSLAVVLLSLGCAGGSTAPRLEEPLFFPLPPDPPRLQYLTSFTRSTDVEEPDSGFRTFVLGETGAVAAIEGPWGVTVDGDRIFVCDLRQQTVVLIDLAAKTFGSIQDSGLGKLRKPIQCEVDRSGVLYVADRTRRQVVCYDPELRYLRAIGPLDDRFLPLDVDVYGNQLFICDMGNRCVQVVDRQTGAPIRVIGGPDDLNRPTNIAIGPSGECHVVDSVRNRVVVYDREGTVVRSIGSPGNVVGQFARAKGIDIDPHGFVYVVDSGTEVCQIFSPQGEIALFFGGPGSKPGQLYLPADVCVTTDAVDHFQSYAAPGFEIEYLVLLVNQYGPFRVNVFGFGRHEDFRYE